jgi:hypothetical protein
MLEPQLSEPKPESTGNNDIRRLVSEILMHPNTDFGSLQIMICSRQDRIEASIAAIQTDLMADFSLLLGYIELAEGKKFESPCRTYIHFSLGAMYGAIEPDFAGPFD